MPYPFQLPTTTATPFSQCLTSSTHPSLPLTTTSYRQNLRQALKSWKRTPQAQQASHIPQLLSTINSYLPYLFALDAGLSGKTVAGEEVDVVLVNEVVVEWKPVLSSSGINVPIGKNPTITSGRAGRVRLKSLESEISFVLLTLSLVHTLAARSELRTLLDDTASSSDPDTRAKVIAKAMRSLLDAQSILGHLLTRTQHAQSHQPSPPSIPDTSPSTIHALSELTLAEATLLAVLKDDPYPALVLETRSKTSKDWMYKAPSIPKVRAHLFARLCLAAADHAATAQSMLAGSSTKNPKPDEALLRYADDLRRTARAKACRLLGIDTEAEGKTGEGIAWLRAARAELGISSDVDNSSPSSGFSKLKTQWREKREDRRIATHGEWGADGGRSEEARIVELLETKWVKANDTVGMQIVPPHGPLLSSMPSGREYHTPKSYKVPGLEEDVVARMRAPPDEREVKRVEEEGDSEDEEKGSPVGAFPGTGRDYEGGGYY